MKRYLLIIFLIFPLVSLSDEEDLYSIDGSIYEILLLTHQEFKKNQPKADIANFIIDVNEDDENYFISYYPKRIRDRQVFTDKNGRQYVVIESHNGNEYGHVREYQISKKNKNDMRVISKTLQGD